MPLATFDLNTQPVRDTEPLKKRSARAPPSAAPFEALAWLLIKVVLAMTMVEVEVAYTAPPYALFQLPLATAELLRKEQL